MKEVEGVRCGLSNSPARRLKTKDRDRREAIGNKQEVGRGLSNSPTRRLKTEERDRREADDKSKQDDQIKLILLFYSIKNIVTGDQILTLCSIKNIVTGDQFLTL